MKFMLALVILVGMGVGSAHASVGAMCMRESSVKGGDSNPWPWGSEIIFPWSRIQGVWAPLADDCSSYFVFKVGRVSQDGTRFIRVQQYNPTTCEKIAEGAGYENRRVITASMVGGGKVYNLTIRAFDDSVLERQGHPRYVPACSYETEAAAKSVIVVSLFPKSADFMKSAANYRLEKITSTPNLLCDEE